MISFQARLSIFDQWRIYPDNILYPQILLFDFIPRYYYLSLSIGFQKMKEGELCYHKLCEREESEMI